MRLLAAEEQEARGARGGAFGPGQALYAQNCQGCHGANLAGGPTVPSLAGISARLAAAEIRKTILEGHSRRQG